MAAEALAADADLLAHLAGVADDAQAPFQHPLALRRQAAIARAALDEEVAEARLELFSPAESVGWVTPHCSAARPKCRSRASAIRYSSLSIMALQPGSAGAGR